MSLNLVYFSGGPRERVLDAVLGAGHRVSRVYANDPDRWPKVRPTLEMARARSIPITLVRRKDELAAIANKEAGAVCLSAGFNFLFPQVFLDAVTVCLNIHGSLLPAYAGARTLSWAIENNETQSGVTVHVVDAGVDTGPILLQRAFPLSRFETTRSLARKTGAFEPDVVVDALALYEQGGSAAARPQMAPPPALLPNRTPEHSRLDPIRSLLSLYDQIRASDADHFPAHFYVDGEKVCVRLWRPDKPANEDDLV